MAVRVIVYRRWSYVVKSQGIIIRRASKQILIYLTYDRTTFTGRIFYAQGKLLKIKYCMIKVLATSEKLP
jgi:hypothetical protein